MAETVPSSMSETTRFVKFLVVGVLNTLIDFGLMNLFTAAFGWSLVLSQALSFTIAVINSYFLNRKWIYPDTTEKSIATQFTKFVVINLAGLGLRSLTISPLDQWLYKQIQARGLQLLSFSSATLSHNLALLIIIPITLILNFVANRFWTFSDVPRSNSRHS